MRRLSHAEGHARLAAIAAVADARGRVPAHAAHTPALVRAVVTGKSARRMLRRAGIRGTAVREMTAVLARAAHRTRA